MIYNDNQLAAFRAFEDSPSVRELKRQLDAGLMSQLEFAREVMSVWGYFRNLPQYAHLNLPKEG